MKNNVWTFRPCFISFSIKFGVILRKYFSMSFSQRKTAMTKCLWTYCFETHQRKIMLCGTSNSSMHPLFSSFKCDAFFSPGCSCKNQSAEQHLNMCCSVWPSQLHFSSTYQQHFNFKFNLYSQFGLQRTHDHSFWSLAFLLSAVRAAATP